MNTYIRHFLVLLTFSLCASGAIGQSFVRNFSSENSEEGQSLCFNHDSTAIYTFSPAYNKIYIRTHDLDGNILSSSVMPANHTSGTYKPIIKFVHALDEENIIIGFGQIRRRVYVVSYNTVENSVNWLTYSDSVHHILSNVELDLENNSAYLGLVDTETFQVSKSFIIKIDLSSGGITGKSDLTSYGFENYVHDLCLANDTLYTLSTVNNSREVGSNKIMVSKFTRSLQYVGSHIILADSANTLDKLIIGTILNRNNSLYVWSGFFGDFARLDYNMNHQWTKNYYRDLSGIDGADGYNLYENKQGFIVASGYYLSVTQLDHNGNHIWSRFLEDLILKSGYCNVISNANAHYVIAARVKSTIPEISESVLIKLDLNGNYSQGDCPLNLSAYDISTSEVELFSFPASLSLSQAPSLMEGSISVEADSLKLNCLDLIISPDSMICKGDTLSLFSQGGGEYAWQPAYNISCTDCPNPKVWPDTTTTYTVSIKNDYCCRDTNLQVKVIINPISNRLGSDTTICSSDSLQLTASFQGGNYLWSTGDTSDHIWVKEPGTYWLVSTYLNCSLSDSIEVDTQNYKPLTLGPDTLLCPFDSMLLAPNLVGDEYLWQDGSTNMNFMAKDTGLFHLNIRYGACTSSDTVRIQLNTDFPEVFIGKDTNLCQGESYSISPSSTFKHYLWNDGYTGRVYNAFESGTYILMAKNDHECYGSDSININFYEVPLVDLGPDQTICTGQTVILDAYYNSNATYLWQDGSSQSTFAVTEAGTYFVRVQNGPCAFVDSIRFEEQSTPRPDLGNDTSMCPGDSLFFELPMVDGMNYIWPDNSIENTYWNYDLGPLIVGLRDGNCIGYDTIQIEALEIPFIDLGKDTMLCETDSLTLYADTNFSYTWSTGASGNKISISEPGMYWIQNFNGNCYFADTIQVGQSPSPIIELGNDTSICEGDTLMLEAYYPGASNQWQDGSSSSIYMAYQTGSYSVRLDLNACSYFDSISVTVQELPVFDLGPDQTLCNDTNLNIGIEDVYDQYLWSTGDTGNAIILNTPGLYWLHVNDGLCTFSDSLEIFQGYTPYFDLGPDTSICQGTFIEIGTPLPFDQYKWNTNDTTDFIEVDASGIYTLMVSNACGLFSDSILIRAIDCECGLYIPNAFSPNKDGMNETFKPIFNCDPKSYELRIFTRWGEVIYSTQDPNTGWNGEHRQQTMKVDTYIYQIIYKFENTPMKKLQGRISLIR